MKLLHLIVAVLGLTCLGSTPVLAQETTCHSLVIRVSPAYLDVTGSLVNAKIYARPSSPEDRVFMVFGNNERPLEINCGASSAYNFSASGLTNEGIASSINPAYVNDSYVTIGQFLQTPSNTNGNSTNSPTELYPLGSLIAANNLSSVFADDNPDTPSSFFYNGNQEIGWGIDSVSTPSLGINSEPDSEGLVALAQITLPVGSSLSGMLNFKVQPDGESINPTEIASVEFNIDALQVGQNENFGNTSGGTAGCMDESACNYTAEACIEDGSCEYLSCQGCTDEAACNYDEEAVADNGSCEYVSCQGCTDETACNYDNEAIADDGSCEYVSCQGCTDETACNYDAEALIDDGSCQFSGCTNGCACNFDPNACEDDGSCAFEDAIGNCGGDCSADLDGDDICDDVDDCVGTYDACGTCNGPGDVFACGCSNIPNGDCDCNGSQLDAIGVCGGDCLQDADGNGICDDDEILGCTVESACNFDADANVNDGTCNFLACLVFGCTDSSACNYDPEATTDNGTCAGFDDCGVCGGLGEIYQCGCDNIPQGDCDCNGNQLDALGVCGGDCTADADADGICDDIDECVGTLDACGVCNGPGEVYECGCADISAGDCDCNGNQLDALSVCGGDCAEDADADGVCDNIDDCVGAFDACGICNGPGEVYECGCNNIPQGDCDCDGNQLDALGVCGGDCTADEDGNGICDDNQGCMYEGALNYDETATADDGSCEWCFADLNGDGERDLDDLLDFLSVYNVSCL